VAAIGVLVVQYALAKGLFQRGVRWPRSVAKDCWVLLVKTPPFRALAAMRGAHPERAGLVEAMLASMAGEVISIYRST
jgi:hypothetical protein